MDQYSSEDASRSSSIVVVAAADIPEPQHQHHQQLPRTRNGRKRKYIADDAVSSLGQISEISVDASNSKM
ncbi:hypothetical protein pipiens_016715 [Culex pipiens pipiens]|uniref:Uncharacterized protein n=1 Tax=Culex pipiens pipiens TaxID=38569 RepID=A0ABD1CK41_CULPP